MKKQIIKISLLISTLMATSASAGTLTTDTIQRIICGKLESKVVSMGGDGNAELAQSYMSNALLNEFLDRGHSLVQIASIMETAEQNPCSKEKKYKDFIHGEIKKTYDFMDEWLVQQGIKTLAEHEEARTTLIDCSKVELMKSNFQFTN